MPGSAGGGVWVTNAAMGRDCCCQCVGVLLLLVLLVLLMAEEQVCAV